MNPDEDSSKVYFLLLKIFLKFKYFSLSQRMLIFCLTKEEGYFRNEAAN